MRLVGDANVLLSALIADSTTRKLIVSGSDTLLAPAYIHEEIERYVSVVVEKTGEDQETPSALVGHLPGQITISRRLLSTSTFFSADLLQKTSPRR